MKEVTIDDTAVLHHLSTIAPDTMETFLLFASAKEQDNAVRGALVNTTRLANVMRKAHDLGILESLILGQAYTGALLMTRSLKGNGRLSLDIGCAGPVRGLSVEAGAGGDVRGYLKQVPIPVSAPLESFDTAPFFGPGILTVKRFPDNSTSAFTGNVDLRYGNIGEDIANYYLVSEQTKTSVTVSIKFDSDGRIIGAGGLFIEALPGATDTFLEDVQKRITAMPSVGETLSAGTEPTDILTEAFDGYTVELMEHRPVRFFCPCSRERFKGFLRSMKLDDLQDLAENGPFPLKTLCSNCNTEYAFSREEIVELLETRGGNQSS